MKKTILFSCAILFTTIIIAQQKPTELDKSPMDMSYWPKDFPLLKMNGKMKDVSLTARIIYGRPQKSNRVIFDGIIKYNEVWRMGANEATEIEFFKNDRVNFARMLHTSVCEKSHPAKFFTKLSTEKSAACECPTRHWPLCPVFTDNQPAQRPITRKVNSCCPSYKPQVGPFGR